MEILTIVIGAGIVLVEYLLGKTSIVKANSTLELVLSVFVKIGKAFKK